MYGVNPPDASKVNEPVDSPKHLGLIGVTTTVISVTVPNKNGPTKSFCSLVNPPEPEALDFTNKDPNKLEHGSSVLVLLSKPRLVILIPNSENCNVLISS